MQITERFCKNYYWTESGRRAVPESGEIGFGWMRSFLINQKSVTDWYKAGHN